jgi:hypothetical protein
MYINFISDNRFTPNEFLNATTNPAGFTAIVDCPGGELQQTCDACAPGMYDHDSIEATPCMFCKLP